MSDYETLLAQARAKRDGQINVTPASDDLTVSQPVTPANDQLPEGAEDRSLLNRSVRRFGQDILATPALAALPRAGIAYAQYLGGINDTFEEGVMTPEAAELYRITQTSQNPDAVNAAGNQLAAMGDDVMRPVMKWSKDWYDWGGEVAGVQNNADGSVPLDEELGGIGLSAAVAIPTGGASLLGRGLGIGGRMANSTAIKVALRAAELATPVTIGPTKANIAANAAVGVALNDAMRYATNEQTATSAVLGLDDDHLPGGSEFDETDAAVTGGAILGTAALSLALGRGSRGRIARAADNFGNNGNIAGSKAPTGKLPQDNPVDVGKRANASVLDENATIKEAVNLTRGASKAQEMDDLIRSHTGNTIDAQIDRAYKLGTLSQDGSVKFNKPINVVRENYSKMDKQQKTTANAVYRALDEIENRKRPGVAATMSESTEELQRRVDVGMRDPMVRTFVNDVDDVMRTMSKWRRAEGVISAGQARREAARGYYMPHVDAEVKPTLTERIADKAGEAFMPRRTDKLTDAIASREQQRKGGIRDLKNISEVFDEYLQKQMREVNKNRVQRELLKNISDRKVTGKEHVLVRWKKPGLNRQTGQFNKQNAGPGEIEVLEDGVKSVYEVGDPRLYRALQFRPRMAIPVLNQMRKYYQMGTTGSFNPMFAPMSAVYDMTFAALGTKTDLITGPVDAALKRAGAPDSVRKLLAGPTRVADIPITYMQGVFHGLYGRRLQMQAQHLAEIAAESGARLDKEHAARAAETFMNSMYGTIHRYGRTGGLLVDYATELDTMRTGMKKHITDSNAVQWYNHLFDTIRDGMQMGMFARNYANELYDMRRAVRGNVDGLTEKQIMKLANKTRQISADPTRHGASGFVGAVTTATPYGNIILQSIGHLVHNMMTNRAAWSVAGFLGATKYFMTTQMSDEQRAHYEQSMPTYDRVGFMPLPLGESVDDMMYVPLGPELGSVVSVAGDVLDGMLRSDQELQVATGMERIQAAIGDLIGFSAPPGIAAPLALMAGTPPRPEDLLKGEPLFREAELHGGIEERRGIALNDGWVSDRIHSTISSAFGTAGRAFIDTVEALLDHPSGSLSGEAWDRAMDVAVYSQARQKPAQAVGTLWGNRVTTNDPRVTPLSDKAYEVDKAMKRADVMFRALDPDYDQALDADIPMSPFQQLEQVMQDPQLQYEAQLVNEYFNSPDHKDIMAEIGQLHKAVKRTRGNPKVPIEQLNKTVNLLNDETNKRYREILRNYDKFETYIREQTQNPNWTITDFVDRAVTSAYTADPSQ